jgi:hypothetical protein
MRMLRARVAGSAGMLLLGVWLVLTGLLPLLNVSFPSADVVLAVLAIVAGILIILGR